MFTSITGRLSASSLPVMLELLHNTDHTIQFSVTFTFLQLSCSFTD